MLYVVLKGIAEGALSIDDPGSLVWIFVKKAIGGPIIGVLFGYTSLWWITHVFNDPMVEISLSITTAYLAYYVSEFGPLESSGVLTVVCVGLCFSKQGRTSISPEVFHFLHEFWETLGYMANTIIFLITGIAIAYNIFDYNTRVTVSDLGISFAIYASGGVIRSCMFLVTYYPFTKMPYGWHWKEMLIASWGGLRGAVGLALGLDVLFSTRSQFLCPDEDDPDANVIACSVVRSRILLHVSMMVVCTLLINASTMKPLLSLLRFVELSREEVSRAAAAALLCSSRHVSFTALSNLDLPGTLSVNGMTHSSALSLRHS